MVEFSKRPRDYYDYDEDDPYYTDTSTRYAGDSVEAQELKNLRYPKDEEDEGDSDYYDDDDDIDDLPPVRRQTTSRQRNIPDEYEDDYYSDDDDNRQEEEKQSVDVGNFWSNPKESLDPIPPPRSRRRRESSSSQRRSSSPTTSTDHRRRRRTSFRSGAPSSPQSISEFYERLFWYGFDTDENMAVGDKTMFGGTKGKFNGLQLFGASNDRPPTKRRRGETPQQFRADEWYDDMMGSINDNGRYKDEEAAGPRRPELPPSRSKRRRSDAQESRFDMYEPPLEETRRSRRREERKDPTASDWVSKEVSTWFEDDEEFEDEETDEDLWKRSHRRPRSRDEQKSPWSITGVLNNVFGVDRDEMDMNAAAYNRQMGLGPKTRRPSNRERRRAGYAYRYDDDEDDTPPVADIEPIVEPAVVDALDVEAVAEEEEREAAEERRRPPRRERTWEERALAVERVPPSGVAAWGPTGEVGVDARTKATLDALEEIREATRKVELKEEQCIDAREDLVVLKADVELQKKRLQASSGDPRRIRARLRQMQEEIDDASRVLRRAKAEEDLARDRLAALEDRHWALLSLYDADKAFQEVVDAFREFEESERATTDDDSSSDTSGDDKKETGKDDQQGTVDQGGSASVDPDDSNPEPAVDEGRGS